MKNFNHLNFIRVTNEKHISVMYFDNGYGVSLVLNEIPYGRGFYYEYEVCVVSADFKVMSFKPITDDVVKCWCKDEVSDIMAQIQNLNPSDDLPYAVHDTSEILD